MNSADIEKMHEQTKALGRIAVASDYIFRPILDGVEDGCHLLIHKVSVPALDETQVCSIHIREMESGFAAKVVNEMRSVGTFVSEMTTAPDSENESVRLFSCKFIEVKPIEWSWHDREQLASYIVSVEMTKI